MKHGIWRPTMLLGVVGLIASTGAQAETISMLPGDDPQVIAYTPCKPDEEAGECISHVLSCRTNDLYGSGLELTVVGQGGELGSAPDIPAMARKLLEKPYGEATLSFRVGGAPVDMTAHNILVTSNELNGDWDLNVRSMDPGAFLDALTLESSDRVSADMGGHEVQLAGSKADGAALMKFKKACTE